MKKAGIILLIGCAAVSAGVLAYTWWWSQRFDDQP